MITNCVFVSRDFVLRVLCLLNIYLFLKTACMSVHAVFLTPTIWFIEHPGAEVLHTGIMEARSQFKIRKIKSHFQITHAYSILYIHFDSMYLFLSF